MAWANLDEAVTWEAGDAVAADHTLRSKNVGLQGEEFEFCSSVIKLLKAWHGASIPYF